MLQARVFEEKIAALYRAGKDQRRRVPRLRSGSPQRLAHRCRCARVTSSARSSATWRAASPSAKPLLDGARTYLGSPLGPMRARDGNIHRGRPQQGPFPHGQPPGHDGQRRGGRAGRPAAARHAGGRRRRDVHRRRRHQHGLVPRGHEHGGRRTAADGRGRGQQPVRVFHAHLAAVRVRGFARPRGGLRVRRARRRWHRPRRVHRDPSTTPSPPPARAAARRWSSPSSCA